MGHKEFEYLLPDAAAGTLDRSSQDLLNAHLEHCASCRDRLEGFRTILPEIRSAKEIVRVPEGYLATIVPRFRARLSEHNISLLNLRWFQLVSPAAAAFVLIGLFSTLRLSPGSTESNGLRSLAAELETSELTDAFLSEIDQQPLASLNAADAFAGTITREAVSRQLLERIAESSDLSPLQSIDDLENKDLDVLLQRLQSRKYL